MSSASEQKPISDDTVLIRVLVTAAWWYPRDAPVRPSSLAFLDSNRENSCFVLGEVDLNELVKRFEGCRFSIVTAVNAQAYNYVVSRDDEGGDGLSGHVLLIYPKASRDKEYRKDAERLAKTGHIFIPSQS